MKHLHVRPFLRMVVASYVVVAAGACNEAQDAKPEEPLPNGMVCLAPNAAILWYNQPAAVFFQDNHARTYYGYLANDSDVLVGAYDHQSRSLLPPFVLTCWEKLDDHGAPSLWVVRHGSRKGTIIAFYSLHSSPMYYRSSAAAEDVSTWEPEQLLDGDRCTYSSVTELDCGRLSVFYTVQIEEQGVQRRFFAVRHSDDGGRSWSDRENVIDFGPGTFPYVAPVASNGDALFLAWAIYRRTGDVGHRNIYCIHSRDGGRSWQTGDGESTQLPIDCDSCDVVHRTPPTRENVIWDTCFDENGMPVIAFVEHDPFGDEGWTGCEAFVTRLDHRTLTWSSPSHVAPLGARCYPSGIVIDRRDTRRVIAGRRTDGGSSLECLEQGSDGRWRTTRVIAPGGPALQMHPAIPRFQQDGLDLIWLDVRHYRAGKEFSCRLMGWDSNERDAPGQSEASVPIGERATQTLVPSRRQQR